MNYVISFLSNNFNVLLGFTPNIFLVTKQHVIWSGDPGNLNKPEAMENFPTLVNHY